MSDVSRRDFIKKNSLSGLGLVVGSGALSSLHQEDHADKPEDEPIVDFHQHTHYLGRTDNQLITHQRNMGVTTTILLPSGHPMEYGSTYYGVGNGLQADAYPNESCYKLASLFPGEFMFGANEVPDSPKATQEIEKYLKLGAPIIGELKFGLDCDSPAMQRIYQLAQEYDVPVHQHWLYNMYNRGFERFHKMLEKYPKVNFIAHSQTWWGYVDGNFKDPNVMYPTGGIAPGGLTDRLLSDYPNLYGDFSAPSGLNALTRDEDYMKDFIERHQDKLLFGSDCTDLDGHGSSCAGAMIIAAIRRISPSKEIARKILFHNSVKLFKIKV